MTVDSAVLWKQGDWNVTYLQPKQYPAMSRMSLSTYMRRYLNCYEWVFIQMPRITYNVLGSRKTQFRHQCMDLSQPLGFCCNYGPWTISSLMESLWHSCLTLLKSPSCTVAKIWLLPSQKSWKHMEFRIRYEKKEISTTRTYCCSRSSASPPITPPKMTQCWIISARFWWFPWFC